MSEPEGEALLEQLRATPLFAEVPIEPLKQLAAAAERLTLRAGEQLIREGDPAEELFVVVSGELEIRKQSGKA
ncbi:MAG TPA: cyclic nucleotide-binding domain-containing protein, partial [Candidatus Limnocylindria bacterium]|nr:cyclic nucleotide-binding domain-containing protein [Candidatus Limnocylindria bacterium]